MWSLLGMNSICCSSRLCCGYICGTCAAKFNTQTIHHARMAYIGLFVTMAILGVIVLAVGPSLTGHLQSLGLLDCESGDSKCIGISTVYRISFSLGIFHTFMVIVCLIGDQFYYIIQQGCWAFKFLLVAGILFLTFFIPNTAFVRNKQDYFVYFQVVFGLIFSVIMIVLLIDFGYAWNQTWLQKYDQSGESNFWSFWLFFFTGVFVFGILGLNITGFFQFPCIFPIISTILTLFSSIVIIVLSLSSYIEHGCKKYLALLTSSFVGTALTYFAFTGFASNPDTECNLLYSTTHNYTQIVFDIGFSLIVLFYFTFRKDGLIPESINQGFSPVMELKSMREIQQSSTEEISESIVEIQKKAVYFHLIMCVWGMTLGFLITNWGLSAGWQQFLDRNHSSMVIRLLQSVGIFGLFAWSLAAPRLCPDRDFSNHQYQFEVKI